MSFHAITRLENFTQWTIRISKDIKTITFHIGNRNSRLKILKNKISLIEKYPCNGLECRRLKLNFFFFFGEKKRVIDFNWSFK